MNIFEATSWIATQSFCYQLKRVTDKHKTQLRTKSLFVPFTQNLQYKTWQMTQILSLFVHFELSLQSKKQLTTFLRNLKYSITFLSYLLCYYVAPKQLIETSTFNNACFSRQMSFTNLAFFLLIKCLIHYCSSI